MFTAAGHCVGAVQRVPAATAAATEVTFQVDPGAYWPWVAPVQDRLAAVRAEQRA